MSIYKFTNLFKQISYTGLNIRNATFKSALSLDKLYPNSITITKFQTPKSTDSSLFNGYIPIEDLQITYSRSGGPGGQHVNKTNSKVDIRFHVESAKWLAKDLKNRLFQNHDNKINREGFFIVRSEKTRCQLLNQADAIAKLREIVYKLEQPELTLSPETKEKLRKNREKANRLRLMDKRMRSSIKSTRNTNQL